MQVISQVLGVNSKQAYEPINFIFQIHTCTLLKTNKGKLGKQFLVKNVVM